MRLGARRRRMGKSHVHWGLKVRRTPQTTAAPRVERFTRIWPR
jgi:hypothetical protein